jgi:hypothetical protein
MTYVPSDKIVEQCPDCGAEFEIERSSCPRCGRIAGWRGKRRYGKSPVSRGLMRRTEAGEGIGCVGSFVLLAAGVALASGLAG